MEEPPDEFRGLRLKQSRIAELEEGPAQPGGDEVRLAAMILAVRIRTLEPARRAAERGIRCGWILRERQSGDRVLGAFARLGRDQAEQPLAAPLVCFHGCPDHGNARRRPVAMVVNRRYGMQAPESAGRPLAERPQS